MSSFVQSQFDPAFLAHNEGDLDAFARHRDHRQEHGNPDDQGGHH